MSVIVACHECGKKFQVRDDKLGKNIKCSGCGAVIHTHAPDAAESDSGDPWDHAPAEEPSLPPPALPPRLHSRPAAPKHKKAAVKERSSSGGGSGILKGVLISLGSFLVISALSCGGCLLSGYFRLKEVVNVAATAEPGEGKDSDPFQYAVSDVPADDRKYLEAAKPIVKAIVAKDYRSFYQMLSSHARASSNPHQFVTPQEEHPKPQADLKDLTADQFVEWMKKMEAARGVPDKLTHVHLESTDPKILSGQAQGFDKLEVMYAIGGMPATIPFNIRKASIRAQVACKLSDEQVKKMAELQKTTPKKVRQEDDEQDEDERGTYFNLKFVLVEEDGTLKVGYFEFMPPSMLD